MNNKFDALKDDDSGDHDQNEENSTQKDGEKEKMDRDKGQSSSKRKAVVPGPAEHPLQYNYTFWYSRRTPGRPTSSQSYEQNIKQIGTFASVEQFWRFYSHMVRPGDLTGHSDFHLFKEGIKPMWEDDANKNGGKWIIRLRKGLASRCWENLILAMLGEQFMVGEEICGAVVSVRFQEDIISIWNKTASDQATTARIRDTLRRVLNLPPNTIMEYKTHTDSIKAWEEFHGLVNSSGPADRTLPSVSHTQGTTPAFEIQKSPCERAQLAVTPPVCALPERTGVCGWPSPLPSEGRP
ncbi:eukaryotic translation initiation factor 4E type 2 isoform X2 [Phyllostomus discolor]|uniref:Eukaryotic translation initiation factor 4E type 2 n=1 Tax=Phyllostomus discolor TaxID=89673 RepID=A0A6J2LH39_9CHIR|nr:eukaryotic translation initiation factor 4E type 2 isoform X2 [Phyllostomus discolor]